MCIVCICSIGHISAVLFFTTDSAARVRVYVFMFSVWRRRRFESCCLRSYCYVSSRVLWGVWLFVCICLYILRDHSHGFAVHRWYGMATTITTTTNAVKLWGIHLPTLLPLGVRICVYVCVCMCVRFANRFVFVGSAALRPAKLPSRANALSAKNLRIL